MLNIPQFLTHVIRPTLVEMADIEPAIHSVSAENLLLGTALVESGLHYLAQLEGGPALGVYQVEPATHDDAWRSFLHYRFSLASRVRSFAGVGLIVYDRNEDDEVGVSRPAASHLVTNLSYATAIARIVYWRAPEPLPEHADIDGLAEYWKAHFNTIEGAGEAEDFVRLYRKHVRA